MAPTLLSFVLGAPIISITYPHTGSNSQAAGGGGSCTYYYSSHGGTPVVTRASCSISTQDLNSGTEPGTSERAYVRDLGGHDGCNNDDAGHILANRLGGKATPTNLFPQSPHLNRGEWESFERTIAACLDSGGASSATLSWTFSYSSTSCRRPSTATYSTRYNAGCSSASKSFSNACTGEPELSTTAVTYPHIGVNSSAPTVTYPHTGYNSQAAGGGGACTYLYSSHGGTPVVTSATCSISTSDLDTGSETNAADREYVRALGGHDGCYNDDAGHILANRLGGKATPTNLVPQSPHLNRGEWESFERLIAECLAGSASSATLSWTFSYSSTSSERPSSMTYSAQYNAGCSSASKSFSNACTGTGPSPPSPSPSGECCYYGDATCSAGQTCCSGSGKSYVSESTCSRYGSDHGCVWDGSSCFIPEAAAKAPLVGSSWVLALQRCNGASTWTLHGLWPPTNDCSGPGFSEAEISDLEGSMNSKWVSCSEYSMSNLELWDHEWTKHGTCSNLGEHPFFSAALSLRNQYASQCSSLADTISCEFSCSGAYGPCFSRDTQLK